MSPRPYRLGQRQVLTEQTRERILTATGELLMTSDGFFGFSIDAVARQADVARMTVYHQFGSKIGLRHALETGASRQAKEHIPPSLYVSTAALESRKLCKTLGI